MKALNLIGSIIVAANLNLAVAADVSFYSEQGYPYRDLVQRADIVKIIYSEDNTNVNCHVEVEKQGKTWRGDQQLVTQRHFKEKPFKHCLARESAKAILNKVFYLK